MTNNSGRTATPKETMEQYGINHANGFISLAEGLLSEIIELQQSIFDGDRSLKIATILSKHYISFHCIGMAYELLYKTTILIEGNQHHHKHEICVLHKQLTDESKQKFEKVVTEHGWTTLDDFSSYLDDYVTNPHKKYFEGGFASFVHKRGHQRCLIDLYHKLTGLVGVIASKNQKTFYHNEGIVVRNEYLI